MKIAVLMAGHIRAWEYCKNNFLETIYDPDHDIDVFIDTYNAIYRTDYHLHNERDMQVFKTDQEIYEMFSGINMARIMIEPEVLGLSELMQKRKLLRVFDAFVEHETNNEKYDLVLRTRPDLILDQKLDYEYIYNMCAEHPKLIFIGNGALHMPENDMFAICNSDTFKIYMRRLIEYPHQSEPMIHHWSMRYISQVYGVHYSQSIEISIVRLDGNGNYRIEK